MDSKSTALAHVIQEALQGAGMDLSRTDEIRNHVARLQYGLPAEDHFLAVLAFLGNCPLCVKLDQTSANILLFENVRIPDLYAVFNHNGRPIRTSIEVKSTSDMKVSWRPDYFESLMAYSEIAGHPVLVAILWKKLGLWSLNDITDLQLAERNYNIRVEQALLRSLMTPLAGDFIIQLLPGVSYCVELFPAASQDGEDQTIVGKVFDKYITDSNGARLDPTRESDALTFLSRMPMEPCVNVEGDKAIVRAVVGEGTEGVFAQQCVHSYFVDDGDRNWRRLMTSGVHIEGAYELKQALDRCSGLGLYRHVIHGFPDPLPSWLSSLQSDADL